jgi:hypothetical protein
MLCLVLCLGRLANLRKPAVPVADNAVYLGVNMESRNPTIQKSQRSKSFEPQTKKATQNTICQGGKSQLIRSKTRNLKISSKNPPKNQKTGNSAVLRGKV